MRLRTRGDPPDSRQGELTSDREQSAGPNQAVPKQYAALFSTAPLGIFVVDADLRICAVNPTARPAFRDIPDLVGREFDQVIHSLWPGADAGEVVRLFRHTLQTGEPYTMPEGTVRHPDTGVTEYYEWQINPIPLPDGRDGVVCHFRDISSLKRAQGALEDEARRKDEFLAMLAHELRNPLGPIRNAVELLSRTAQIDPRAQAAINIVRRQTVQLTRLVDDLLDVSRITRARIELKCQRIQLADIVFQAVETVEPQFREKGHKVSVTPSDRPLHVNGDPARLVQCVANILSNAAKYTDQEGHIRVDSCEADGEAVLTITDNGAGIPAELLPHVFDLFVQNDRTLDRAQGGLGIGLAIVKRLVEMHGGRVCAASGGLGRGATFEIRLPLLERDDQSAPERPRPAPPPRRILLVDDNHDAADSLAMILTLEGHEVAAVYTAQKALERIQSFRPEVVLLDIGLPEMDGYELARRIRALPDLERVHLVALTGYGRVEDKERARAAGFDDHLLKPVEFVALQQALVRAARPHKLHSAVV